MQSGYLSAARLYQELGVTSVAGKIKMNGHNPLNGKDSCSYLAASTENLDLRSFHANLH